MFNTKKIHRLGSVGVLLLAAAFSGAQGSDSTGTATVTLLPTISITRNADTNWGRVVVPASGTATYILDDSTGATSLSSGAGFSFSDGNAGDYSITGAANCNVSFSVSVGSFSGSGVSISAMSINGSANSGTGQLDGSGHLTIKLGGTLDVASTATITTQTATINLTVDYQ